MIFDSYAITGFGTSVTVGVSVGTGDSVTVGVSVGTGDAVTVGVSVGTGEAVTIGVSVGLGAAIIVINDSTQFIKFVVYSAHKLPSLTARPNKYVFEMSGISVYSYISFAVFVFVSNSKTLFGELKYNFPL